MKKRGYLIKKIFHLLVLLQKTSRPLTVLEISGITGMGLRQAYRYIHAAQDMGIVDECEGYPVKYIIRKEYRIEHYL